MPLADVVTLDYDPPTLHAGNLASHLLFDPDRSHVRSTMVAGRFVLRDGRGMCVDEAAPFVRARAAAAGGPAAAGMGSGGRVARRA